MPSNRWNDNQGHRLLQSHLMRQNRPNTGLLTFHMQIGVQVAFHIEHVLIVMKQLAFHMKEPSQQLVSTISYTKVDGNDVTDQESPDAVLSLSSLWTAIQVSLHACHFRQRVNWIT